MLDTIIDLSFSYLTKLYKQTVKLIS